jgi:hypothetical protein
MSEKALITYSSKNDLDSNPIILSYPEENCDIDFGLFDNATTILMKKNSKLDMLYQDIDKCEQECSQTNWDGNGTAPLNKDSVKYAKQFIASIPESFPLPELAPEPSGELGLEWHSNNCHLAISIDDKKKLAFAILTPEGKSRGLYDFNKDKFLKEIEVHLSRFI